MSDLIGYRVPTFTESDEFGVAESPHSEEKVMNFGQALDALKMGRRVARNGWNGKGMFVFLVPGSNFKVNRPPLLGIYPEGTEINYRPHIDLKGADGSISTWAPSGSDALAEDWLCIDGDFGDTNTLESLQQEARLKLVHELMEILGTDDVGRIVEIVRDLKGQ